MSHPMLPLTIGALCSACTVWQHVIGHPVVAATSMVFAAASYGIVVRHAARCS